MARTFVAASSQSLDASSAPVVGYPFTIAAWVRPTSSSGSQTIAALKRNAAADDRDVAALSMNTSIAGRFSIYSLDGSGTGGFASTTAGFTNGVWAHVAAVFAGVSSRAVYMNGGNKGTNATTLAAFGTFDRISVGRIPQASPYLASADIAELAVWSIALSDADVASVALGLSPLLVRPDALVFYAPIAGAFSPEIELIGRRDLALAGGPAIATHPPLYLPTTQIYTRHTVIFTIAGVTKNAAGVVLGSATVKLFRTSDDVLVGSTVSDGSGNYSFTVPNGSTQYYAVASEAGSPAVFGTTANTLVGV